MWWFDPVALFARLVGKKIDFSNTYTHRHTTPLTGTICGYSAHARGVGIVVDQGVGTHMFNADDFTAIYDDGRTMTFHLGLENQQSFVVEL